MEKRLRRPLGTFETALTLTGEAAPFVVVVCLRLESGPSKEALRKALATLQLIHPLLRVRILRGPAGFYFEPRGTPEIPLEIVPRKSPEAWRGSVEAELNRPIALATAPLLRCIYLVSSSTAEPLPGDGCEIVLTFHHAVMDAASGNTVIRQLLALLGPEPGGEASTAEAAHGSQEALPPVESRFGHRYRGFRGLWQSMRFLTLQMVDEAFFRLGSRGGRRPSVVPGARCRILTEELSQESTKALVRQVRRRRVTLNSTLAATFLLAAGRLLYGDDSRPLRYLTFANLRPYLCPPVGEGALGSYLAMLRYTAERRPEDDLWALSGRISKQIAAGLRRGDKFSSIRFSSVLMRSILGQNVHRMAATAVSYTGITRLQPPTDGPLSYVPLGMHGFVSNLSLGPEVTAQARMLGGKLMLDMVYLDSDMDSELAAAVAREIVDSLETVTEGAST